MTRPTPIEIDALVERYDGFLLDSYGVLVDSDRALPGAARFIERLVGAGKAWLVVSNDASRLPATAAGRYRRLGLPIDVDRILTSGDLIRPHLHGRNLRGGHAIVLGPADSRELVRQAGMALVDASDREADAVVVCDDDGYPFVSTIERTIETIVARRARGLSIELVLPNPDLIYPRGPERIGLTAGSVALLVESALRVQMGARAPSFTRLGKPHAPMFAEARRRLALPTSARLVMLGDQLATDIAGAIASGIDSVLLGTGLCDIDGDFREGPRPTWVLPRLE